MATNNLSTHGYYLDPEIAASLRAPLIDYPGGIVPHRVLAKTVIDGQTGFTPEAYPALGDDMPLQDVLSLLDQHTAKRH